MKRPAGRTSVGISGCVTMRTSGEKLESSRTKFSDSYKISSSKDQHLIDKKQKIVAEGAFRLFSEKGFHKTSTREIADACGMSKGQLYHYISSKEDILFLIYKQIRRSWYQEFMNSGLDVIEDPLERFVASLRYTMNHMLEYRDAVLFLYIQSVAGSEENSSAVLKVKRKETIDFWKIILKDISGKYDLSIDIDFVSNFVSNTILYFALEESNIIDTSGNSTEYLIEFLLRGIGLKNVGAKI